MKKEKNIIAVNGFTAIGLVIVFIIVTVFGVVNEWPAIFIPSFILLALLIKGYVIITPNSSRVFLFLGKYVGTLKENGFWWVLPFYNSTFITLRARNMESEKVKVNDKMGNPILISVILVWKVEDTYKASFDIDNYENFVRIQTDSAVRKLAGTYPYDHFEDERATVTLSTNFDVVNKSLEHEISERLNIAGIVVIEARIGYLAYAPEIAQAMLRRQQASAIVAARHKIVEGAVGMVENALTMLSEKSIINLDEEKKASMVSNLMVVLCGDKDMQPVINTGTLN